MARKLITILLCLVGLSGCSVFLAAKGSDKIDFSDVQVGASRSAIEAKLGKPISFLRQRNGDVALYQVVTGDKGDGRRAATYAVLDGLTLGLAEFVSFPMEELQGDRHIFEVTYSTDRHAINIKHTFKGAPLPDPSKVLEEKLKTNERPA